MGLMFAMASFVILNLEIKKFLFINILVYHDFRQMAAKIR